MQTNGTELCGLFGNFVLQQQPQIILLKEGTDTSQGKPQLISNINACLAVVDAVRTTLGPRGMDKLIHDDKGTTTISNDGATIMKLLDIVHPAAKILVDIAKSQDAEVCFLLDHGLSYALLFLFPFYKYFMHWFLIAAGSGLVESLQNVDVICSVSETLNLRLEMGPQLWCF